MSVDLSYVNIAKQIEENIQNLENFRFLVQATSVLSSSVLDYEEMLRQMARLAVPHFADWCTIHIRTDEGPEQIVVAHVDPSKVSLATELQEKYPPDPDSTQGVAAVMRSGKAQMMSEIPRELLLASARNEHHKKILEELSLKSYMCVPLLARSRVLGAITFVSAESGRIYTVSELAIVEDLAHIAAISIDNALLYKQAQDEIYKREKAEQEIIELNKSLEQKVVERTTELYRSNQELTDFAYVASHDLQEPLRKIQSFGNLLREEKMAMRGEGRLYVERMLDAAGRMRVLIDDLLAYSRVTTKAQPFAIIDLNTVVAAVLSDMETRISEQDARISVDFLPSIEADPTHMRQMVQNFLSNSLKFRKKDGILEIHIGSTTDSDLCTLTFEDNGIGFDEKYEEQIFTIFEKLHGRNEYEGTGIGLAVVKKIIERHNGSINVKSTPGIGSTFIVTLPLRHIKKGLAHA
jgi:signal transduction histidine kinase